MSALLAKLHIAKKQLALADAEYRGVLHRVTGKASAAALSVPELTAVLSEFERLGFKGVRKPTKRAPHVRKVYALWGELQTRGAVVRGPRGAGALRAFVRRQAGVAAPEFLTPEQSASVIEALKSWIDRADPRKSTTVLEPAP